MVVKEKHGSKRIFDGQIHALYSKTYKYMVVKD